MNESSSMTVDLAAPIDVVQRQLVKLLKPGRAVVSAVKFADGSVEELRAASFEVDTEKALGPHRTPGETLPEPQEAKEEPPKPKAVKKEPKAAPPVAATTVAQPTIGCPLPEFQEAEVKATRVLETFLQPDQLADFRRTQSFISLGGDTGHRYLLCSRNAPKSIKEFTRGWQVYDLDEGRSFCVHDWELPAAEELLSLHLFISMAGREHYVRGLR